MIYRNIRFMARVLRAWAINRTGKNSVCNLWYRPQNSVSKRNLFQKCSSCCKLLLFYHCSSCYCFCCLFYCSLKGYSGIHVSPYESCCMTHLFPVPFILDLSADLSNDMWEAVAFLVLLNIQFNTGKMIYPGHIDNWKKSGPCMVWVKKFFEAMRMSARSTFNPLFRVLNRRRHPAIDCRLLCDL